MSKNQEDIINQLKEELQIAISSLSILMETVSYLIWIKDNFGRYIQVNQSYASFCGKSIKDLLGQTDIDVWGPDLIGKPFIENFVSSNAEVIIIERQELEHPVFGKQYFKVVVAPVLKINGGNSFVTVGIAVNITDQIDKENIAKAAIIELQQQLKNNEFIK